MQKYSRKAKESPTRAAVSSVLLTVSAVLSRLSSYALIGLIALFVMSCRSPRSVESSVLVKERSVDADSASSATSAHTSIGVTMGNVGMDSAQVLLIRDMVDLLPIGASIVERQGNLILQAERTPEGMKVTGMAPSPSPVTLTAESAGVANMSQKSEARHERDDVATAREQRGNSAADWWVWVTLGVQCLVVMVIGVAVIQRQTGRG